MPGSCCAVFGCCHRGGHTFPKDKKIRNQWRRAIKRDSFKPIRPWWPTASSLVCKAHFLDSDYEEKSVLGFKVNKKKLKKTAVPSQFAWSKVEPSSPALSREKRLKERNEKRRLEKEEVKQDECRKGESAENDAVVQDLNLAMQVDIESVPVIQEVHIQTDPLPNYSTCTSETQTEFNPSPLGKRVPSAGPASKVKRRYSRGYRKSQEHLEAVRRAVEEALQDTSYIKRTAAKYNLEYHFLYRRVLGTVEVESRNGPDPVHSADEEKNIAHFISEMALRGMGLGPSNVMDLVQNFLQQEKRKTVFHNNRPGYTWYYAFSARHGLALRKGSSLEASRAKVTPAKLDEWFSKYKRFMSYRNLLDQPHRIWNADETGFTMGSKTTKVMAPEMSSHPIPQLSGGSLKNRFTVMYCANAEGAMIPPFIIFPNKKPTGYDPLVGATIGAHAEYTDKGWMDASTFSMF
ncbi:uncharacterized protein LOC119733886 [Patiria miniata]|uniref:THAP-type domain-containing protein n=1 Tax=Patiria miniata TaxID=46514 RepID=A0A914AHM0_PATMI|nr:uncharacterized protein LOC119733886 [Patiria miniata]